MIASAYLGEMLVRNHGWRWRYDTDRQAATVESPDGRWAGYPHDKVAKRVRKGDRHDLAVFYAFAGTGEAPPGTEAREVRPPWWRRG
ncbi:hypothetical protein ACIBF7_42370 [Nonomuraea sp. NPDC050478]|uniref:hypothetical protein n=1 Tax=Nonomuraea sp. NPDC050478 TaxID=3364365 RepID=UPI00379C2D8A